MRARTEIGRSRRACSSGYGPEKPDRDLLLFECDFELGLTASAGGPGGAFADGRGAIVKAMRLVEAIHHGDRFLCGCAVALRE